jgi:Plavaka transposase
MPETEAAEFEVGGVLHRDIIDIITSVYQSDAVKSFNHIPFKEFWMPSEDAPPNHLYGEIFSSEEMLDADADICKCCLEEDHLDSEGLEVACVPLLLYLDSTHLTNFGTASCWPVYMFFGSQSKYVWAMPTSFTCHHIAYMPSVRHIQYVHLLS